VDFLAVVFLVVDELVVVVDAAVSAIIGAVELAVICADVFIDAAEVSAA